MCDVGVQLLAASKEIARLNARVHELEADLKLNSSMLAKQCDLAREAEARVKELEGAIREHKDRDDRYIDGDRELYAHLPEPSTDVDKSKGSATSGDNMNL